MLLARVLRNLKLKPGFLPFCSNSDFFPFYFFHVSKSFWCVLLFEISELWLRVMDPSWKKKKSQCETLACLISDVQTFSQNKYHVYHSKFWKLVAMGGKKIDQKLCRNTQMEKIAGGLIKFSWLPFYCCVWYLLA